MLLTSGMESVELTVEENTNGSPVDNARHPVVVLCLFSFLLKPTTLPATFRVILWSERDVGRPANDAGRKNARKQRGLPGLDHEPIHQIFPSSPPVQSTFGTEDDFPGSHCQVCEAEGSYQVLERCPR